MTEEKIEYKIEIGEETKKYQPWNCPNCGKTLGYVYRDANHISRLLVSRDDGVVYHILAADVRCTCWTDVVHFRLDPKVVESVS